MLSPEVESEVQGLLGLPLDGLRDAWPARFGALPKERSADVLRRLLAWKLQEEAYGGLDAETRQLLTKKAVAPRGPSLATGTRLVREWKGELHEVQIDEDSSPIYRGDAYTSLSEVARKITGARWNGPRFFGLRGRS